MPAVRIVMSFKPLVGWLRRRPRGGGSAGTDRAVAINPLFDADYYRKRYDLPTLAPADLYQHYRTRGIALGHDPNMLFSTRWYVERNPDVRRLRLDPLDHYLAHGAAEGRDPGPDFSDWGYRLLHEDVRAGGMNPLLHYLRHGRFEGRIVPTDAFLSASLREPFAACFASREARKRMATAARRAPGDGARPAADGGTTPVADAAGRAKVKPLPRPASDAAAERVIAQRSPLLVAAVAALFAIDLARSFDAVRLLGSLPEPVDGPLVLVTNHPSRWDAELFHWLARHAFPERRGFAPMVHHHLSRHPLLRRLGAFATRPGGYGGACAFLRTAERLLLEPDAVLFVAAEGRYSDVRCRPVHVMPGVAHLARHAAHATFVPLAIDYVFWDRRRPNLLLHFGSPVQAAALRAGTSAEIADRLSAGLAAAMSALAEAAQTRRPACFATLLPGGNMLAALGTVCRRRVKRASVDGVVRDQAMPAVTAAEPRRWARG